MKLNIFSTKNFSSINAILIYLALFKLALLIIFASNYGLFRDEYYYIEISKHLAFGYVDVQPLTAIILAVSRALFGDSIFGIRIFSYLAGSAIVIVAGLIVGFRLITETHKDFIILITGEMKLNLNLLDVVAVQLRY